MPFRVVPSVNLFPLPTDFVAIHGLLDGEILSKVCRECATHRWAVGHKTQNAPRRIPWGMVLMGRWRLGGGLWRQFRQGRLCRPADRLPARLDRRRCCLHPCDKQRVRDEVIWCGGGAKGDRALIGARPGRIPAAGQSRHALAIRRGCLPGDRRNDRSTWGPGRLPLMPAAVRAGDRAVPEWGRGFSGRHLPATRRSGFRGWFAGANRGPYSGMSISPKTPRLWRPW